MSVEWVHIALIVVGWMVGAAVGVITGTWKLASTVANTVSKLEREIRRDFSDRESRLYEKIAGAIADREAKLGELSFQFDETLKALRQKINDVELSTTKYFVAKGEFDGFRTEYREDISELKRIISDDLKKSISDMIKANNKRSEH